MISSIENDIELYDALIKKTTAKREALVGKLSQMVDTIQVDVREKSSKQLESEIGVITALDSLLKSHENSLASSIKVKLQNKITSSDLEVKEQVVEILKHVSITKGKSNSSPDIKLNQHDIKESMLEDIVAKNCVPISDAELTAID
jgi:hypothetical protein